MLDRSNPLNCEVLLDVSELNSLFSLILFFSPALEKVGTREFKKVSPKPAELNRKFCSLLTPVITVSAVSLRELPVSSPFSKILLSEASLDLESVGGCGLFSSLIFLVNSRNPFAVSLKFSDSSSFPTEKAATKAPSASGTAPNADTRPPIPAAALLVCTKSLSPLVLKANPFEKLNSDPMAEVIEATNTPPSRAFRIELED